MLERKMMLSSGKCARCYEGRANPVLCNQCAVEIKEEYRSLFNKIVKYAELEKEDVD
jgi:hypothetical protein